MAGVRRDFPSRTPVVDTGYFISNDLRFIEPC